MKKKILALSLICMIILTSLIGCSNNSDEQTYRIRFKNLVNLSDIQKYNGKEVEAVGFLSPISPVDGSFAYLMNMPYQTCPYCAPEDGKITNTLSIFPKNGSKIEYTESAVIVKGTLKIEEYTDAYGYTYDCRLVDVTVTTANENDLGEKIAIYNQIAETGVLSNILNVLTMVDYSVFHEDYGIGVDELILADEALLDEAITKLNELNKEEYKLLLEIAKDLKQISKETNQLLNNKKYDELATYKQQVNTQFEKIGKWMSEYEL